MWEILPKDSWGDHLSLSSQDTVSILSFFPGIISNRAFLHIRSAPFCTASYDGHIIRDHYEKIYRWENPNQCLRPPAFYLLFSTPRPLFSLSCGNDKQLIRWFIFFFSAATSQYTFYTYSVKYSTFRASQVVLVLKRLWFDPWVRKIPWRREWQLTPEFLPGEFHGQRILAGYSL